MRPGGLVLVGSISATLVAAGWALARLLPFRDRPGLEVGLLALFGAVAGLVACVLTNRLHRRQMRLVADLVRAQREHPATGTLDLARRSLGSSDAEAV